MNVGNTTGGGSRSALDTQGSEESQLFSLHSLTKQGSTAPEQEAPGATQNESGLIDLAALAVQPIECLCDAVRLVSFRHGQKPGA